MAIYGFFAAIVVFTSQARAATVDRIEVVVNGEIITELDLEEDIRVTDFLNGSGFNAKADSHVVLDQRRTAADRLIDQALIKQEMALSHYLWVAESEIDQSLEKLRQARGAAAFEASLEENEISLAVLRRHLALQLTTMRFVAFRFHPELEISGNDLEDSYRRLTSKWAAEHPNQPLPSFEASRSNIRRVLAEERMNQALDGWLHDARQRAQIDYVDPVLQAVK